MKVYLDMVGCRLNQAEIEQYGRQLREQGHSLVANPEDADMAVVNTCMVTSAAESDSRQKIRQLHRKGVSELVVTGCWASLKPDAALALPGVSRVVENEGKDQLVRNYFSDEFEGLGGLLYPVDGEEFDRQPLERQPLERQPLPGTRQRTRAFIKVQDGCDNVCTFCITTVARGRSRSRSMGDVIEDIQFALGNGTRDDQNELHSPMTGAKEIVLTGVHLGSWGQDLNPALRLADLVRVILEQTDVQRLRLSSLEPWDLDASFFSMWEDERLCRHLHLPLQSGCAETLRRMARKTNPKDFASLVAGARSAIPDVAITTDIITGFPGESEDEFNQSLEFIESMEFADGHVFTYSERPGTAAVRLGKKVPRKVSKDRNATIRSILESSSLKYRLGFLGQELAVLWESATTMDENEWELTGLTDNYLRVWVRTPQPFWNVVTPVRLVDVMPGGLRGAL